MTARVTAEHQHETWMMRQAPDGTWYCAACGKTPGENGLSAGMLHAIRRDVAAATNAAEMRQRAAMSAGNVANLQRAAIAAAMLLAELDRLRAVPTEQEAEAVGVDLYERSLRARGLTHALDVIPNENGTGWIVDVSSPLGAANLPQPQAEVLARLLLAGPGEAGR